MELYQEMLLNLLAKEPIEITFTNLKVDATAIIELKSYQTLQQIKTILADDNLSDPECFMKIEEIICLFEDLGTDIGARHDF